MDKLLQWGTVRQVPIRKWYFYFIDCGTVCRWACATQRTDDWADCSRGTGPSVAGGLRSCRTCPPKKKNNNNNENPENGWGSRWVRQWCVCAWCEREWTAGRPRAGRDGDNGSRSPCAHFFLYPLSRGSAAGDRPLQAAPPNHLIYRCASTIPRSIFFCTYIYIIYCTVNYTHTLHISRDLADEPVLCGLILL